MAVKRGPKGDAAPKRTPKAKRKAGKTRKPATQKTPTPKATGKRAPAVLAVPPALANNAKPKRGRPSLYRSEFCDQIRDLAREGMSKAELALELGISRQCWSEWIEAHPEFGDAVKDAEFIAQAWWERKGRQGITMGKDFNANAWRYQVFNRFSGDYRDRRQVEHDTSDGLAGLLRELDGGTGRFR